MPSVSKEVQKKWITLSFLLVCAAAVPHMQVHWGHAQSPAWTVYAQLAFFKKISVLL